MKLESRRNPGVIQSAISWIIIVIFFVYLKINQGWKLAPSSPSFLLLISTYTIGSNEAQMLLNESKREKLKTMAALTHSDGVRQQTKSQRNQSVSMPSHLPEPQPPSHVHPSMQKRFIQNGLSTQRPPFSLLAPRYKLITCSLLASISPSFFFFSFRLELSR